LGIVHLLGAGRNSGRLTITFRLAPSKKAASGEWGFSPLRHPVELDSGFRRNDEDYGRTLRVKASIRDGVFARHFAFNE
jgi:hypothetical protein